MDLGKGPRQPNMVVKKENERAGKLSRTKYFIRIGECNMMPEIKEPVNLPDGGFIVPMQVDIGSSDFLRPQMPTPGDIRRMFGNDKIDCEPEYARGLDPDWSRVSPTTPEELENKVREWNASTNAVLSRYRDIEDSRRNFDKNIKWSKLYKRTHSEGDKIKNFKYGEHRVSSPVKKQQKKYWKNSSREVESPNATSCKSSDNNESPRQMDIPNNNKDLLCGDGRLTKAETQRIPYSPKKIRLKSYNTAISVVQKMTSDHWIMIDKLYNDIKREKGINLGILNKRVMKIVRDIYGIESEFILSTIHRNPVQRIIKLGKLMLNIYYEAMFGSHYKKLVVPGINNQRFAQKCLKAYTFTPHYKTTRMTSKMYQRLTASRDKPPKCAACYGRYMERESTLRKNLGRTFSTKKNKQMTPFRTKRRAPERLKKSKIIKLSRPNSSTSSGRQNDATDKEDLKNSNSQKSQMMLYIPPFLAKEQEGNSTFDSVMENTNESKLTLSSAKEDSLDEVESSQEMSIGKIEKTEEDESVNSGTENLGAGDSLVQFSNDYNYLLSSLYESSSSISLEMSKKLCSSPIMATFGSTTDAKGSDQFFASTANILELNEQLEKMLLKEKREKSSRCYKQVNSDSEEEQYIDCEGAEGDESYTFLRDNQQKVQKKNYKYSKWMCLTDDCRGHRGYITFFMTIMLGLTTAIFCRDSFLNRVKGDPSMKEGVKQVIKTFLLGALRLVDGF